MEMGNKNRNKDTNGNKNKNKNKQKWAQRDENFADSREIAAAQWVKYVQNYLTTDSSAWIILLTNKNQKYIQLIHILLQKLR